MDVVEKRITMLEDFSTEILHLANSFRQRGDRKLSYGERELNNFITRHALFQIVSDLADPGMSVPDCQHLLHDYTELLL